MTGSSIRGRPTAVGKLRGYSPRKPSQPINLELVEAVWLPGSDGLLRYRYQDILCTDEGTVKGRGGDGYDHGFVGAEAV